MNALTIALPCTLAVGLLLGRSQEPGSSGIPAERVTSEVRRTDVGERILVHEAWLEAPVEEVWDAYTTEEGWTAWASPQARIDLRCGGELLSAYQGVTLGEEGTNRLTVVNYVPLEVLTLQADVSKNWPEVMKRDAENLFNVILFDELPGGWTHVRSFGIGYSDAPQYERMMGFFEKANADLMQSLRRYVEKGERTEW